VEHPLWQVRSVLFSFCLGIEVQVKDMLQLTVSQSVCLGVKKMSTALSRDSLGQHSRSQ
jgi:hypothetical protein